MELIIFFTIGIILNIILRNATLVLTEYAFIVNTEKQLVSFQPFKKISKFQKIVNYYLVMLLPYINIILFYIYWNTFFKTKGSLLQKIYASIFETKKYSSCLY